MVSSPSADDWALKTNYRDLFKRFLTQELCIYSLNVLFPTTHQNQIHFPSGSIVWNEHSSLFHRQLKFSQHVVESSPEPAQHEAPRESSVKTAGGRLPRAERRTILCQDRNPGIRLMPIKTPFFSFKEGLSPPRLPPPPSLSLSLSLTCNLISTHQQLSKD